MESGTNFVDSTAASSVDVSRNSPVHIRKFVASSMKEAMRQIKKEMGENAVILKSHVIPNSDLFSFRSKEKVEVLAALEPLDDTPTARITSSIPNMESTGAQRQLSSEWEMEVVKDEIKTIRATLEEIANRIKYQSIPTMPRQLKLFYQSMVGSGLDEELVMDMTGQALGTLSGDQLDDRKVIADFLGDKLAPMIPTAPYLHHEPAEPRVVAFVGPTGMGKTTTISKLLTHKNIFRGRRMAVITADTYRIGATDQIKRVAEIAKVPIVVAYKPSQMLKAIQRHQDKNVIFIDTAGRSPHNRHHMKNLQEFMGAAQPDEVHLVLAANTRLEDLKETADRFNQIQIHRYLFTKLDETSGYGNIVNLIKHREKPISFLGFGQRVPNEIRWAKSKEFARMLILGNRYGGVQVS